MHLALFARRLGWWSGTLLYLRSRLRFGQFTARVLNGRYRVRIRGGTTDITVFRHALLEDEFAFPAIDASAARWIIDGGANVGFSSLALAARFPAATVIAVEPDPANFAMLAVNCRDEDRIKPLRAALWGTSRPLEVVHPGGGEWSTTVVATTDRVGRTPGLTIADVMQQFGVARVDIIKLDIEGAEFDLLAASDAGVWLGAARALLIELHEWMRPGVTELFERRMREHSFRTRAYLDKVLAVRSDP